MQKIYLINEFDYDMPDIQGYMTGNEDYPITDLGMMRAELVNTELCRHKLNIIYSSPLLRCKDAAKLMFGSVTECEELSDAHLGLWQGLGLDEIQTKWPEEYSDWLFNPVSTPPEAEPMEQRVRRLEEFLTKCVRQHSDDIAVFTHKNIVAPFIADLLGLPEDKMTHIQLPFGAVTTIEWTGSSFSVLNSGEQIIPSLDDSTIDLFLDHYKVSESESARCLRIAEQARQWALQLSETGLLLDADTVFAAGRLQSIGGPDQEGAELGGRILDTMGYADEAFAVLNHIQVFFRSIINEAVLLYLANRSFSYGDKLSFDEVFQRDRARIPDSADTQIELDKIIIHMINALYDSELIPLSE